MSKIIKKKSPGKSRSTSLGTKSTREEKEYIVIDEAKGLIFESEQDLFGYFEDYIETLENEYQALRTDTDFSDEEQLAFGAYLDETLDHPTEVWMDAETFEDLTVFHFIKSLENYGETAFYVSTVYVNSVEENPTFVFIHFPTRSSELVENYKRGEMVYDKTYERALLGAIEGDALSEGDPLALGLYTAMLTVRGEKDVAEESFADFIEFREDTIENADEIWRKTDLDGNVLVSFIKEFPDHETLKDLAYIAVTQEDDQSNVHSLLFSFPTIDKSLVDRYRQGENLQAEEISQENAH